MGRTAELLLVVAALAYGLAVATLWSRAEAAVAVGTALLVVLVALIAWQDARTLTIADGATAALAIVGVTLRLHAGQDAGLFLSDELIVIGLEAGATFAVLFALREYWYRRRGFDGLGFGDVKLAAAGAAALGAPAFSAALFVASLAGLAAFGLLRIARGPAALTGRLAFGAFLAPAIAAVQIVVSRTDWLAPLAGMEWRP